MKRLARWATAAVLTLGLASPCLAPIKADEGETKLKVGDSFPDVALAVTNAKEVLGKEQDTLKISDLRGKNVVVYFFPKAMTPG